MLCYLDFILELQDKNSLDCGEQKADNKWKKGIIEKPVSSFCHDTLAISLHINASNIQHELCWDMVLYAVILQRHLKPGLY